MAARLTARQSETTCSAIKTTKLVQKLQRHVLEDEDMNASQVNAARILLNKTLPDQKVIDANIEGDLTVQVMNYADRSDSK